MTSTRMPPGAATKPVETRIPKTSDLVRLAREHDKAGFLEALAQREDARAAQKHLAAVGSFNFLTDNPKKTVKEAEWAGLTYSGEITETSETLISILWSVCNGDN